MTPLLFYIDIETRSELDVTRVGSYVYAAHPSTEILCAAYAWGDEPVQLWLPGQPWPSRDEPVTYVAHNIDFEREVLAAKHNPAWSHAPWLDTAALAARMSLPRNLEELAAFFGYEKDMGGRRVMLQLSKPRRPSKDNPDKWWTPTTKPAEFEQLYQYCMTDVWVMRAVHQRLLPLTPQEQRVQQLTEEMNRLGVDVDLSSLPLAQRVVTAEAERLAGVFRELTGVPARSPVRAAAALGLPDMQKATVRKALRAPGNDERRGAALRTHQALARSSTAKLAALARRTCADGRLRGSLVYCGAERTGRWSSVGVQLQNLPRGLGETTDEAFSALKSGVLPEVFTGMERPPPDRPLDILGTVAEMLRGFLVGPFIIGDKAQIEARTLAWLAGQEDLLQLFRDHGDPYCAMASKVYDRPITKGDKAERFMGKQLVLGAGYGLGWKGFQRLLDETYDVAVPDEFAERVVRTYRLSNPAIVEFWGKLERAWAYVVRDRKELVRVSPQLKAGWLEHGNVPYAFFELPSGRRMYYARPELKADELRYFGRDIHRGGAWGEVHTYGGKLAENVTQAIARDALAESMLRLYDAGYKLVLTVHDEAVVLDNENLKLEEFKSCMEQAPTWAEGLPIEVEVFKSYRYRK